MKRHLFNSLLSIIVFVVGGCEGPLNNPYPPAENDDRNYYCAYLTRPKHFDPARAYYTHELEMISNVYEPVLDYHFLKRPYELTTLNATAIPQPVYYDTDGNVLTGDPPAEMVAQAEYTIRIKPGINYAPHPAFAKRADGSPRYANLTDKDVIKAEHIGDFDEFGTRELRAADYVNQICRLADPRLNCPIYSTMKQYIVGLAEYHSAVEAKLARVRKDRASAAGDAYNERDDERNNPIVIDYLALAQRDFPGVKIIDDHTYQIVLRKKYPQMRYWLAMTFFAPIPQEAMTFYGQGALTQRDITLDRFPVSTGPFHVVRNITELEIIMERNPHYHDDFYPSVGEDGDREAGWLEDAGRKLPFIDRIVWKFEKESLPRWNKFLQGYYDHHQKIGQSTFQQITDVTAGKSGISAQMKDRGIRLSRAVDFTIWEFAFNMSNRVVGGLDEKQRKLRHAIAIAVDNEEFIRIFLDDRAVSSHGPIPPGIFGAIDTSRAFNPVVYDWDEKKKAPVRKSLDEARRLLAEAGYANGVGPDGKQLTITFDNSLNAAQYRPRILWLQKKFAEIGIHLESRTTDHSTYRDKLLNGNFQVAQAGWSLDYPDPENFLFLLYSKNGKATTGGENISNYSNPKIDELFLKMESMNNGPERQAVIDELVTIVQQDCPWVFLYHPEEYILYHDWTRNAKTNLVTRNTFKYLGIDVAKRQSMRKDWNRPVWWPVLLLVGVLIVACVPAARVVSRR